MLSVQTEDVAIPGNLSNSEVQEEQARKPRGTYNLLVAFLLAGSMALHCLDLPLRGSEKLMVESEGIKDARHGRRSQYPPGFVRSRHGDSVGMSCGVVEFQLHRLQKFENESLEGPASSAAAGVTYDPLSEERPRSPLFLAQFMLCPGTRSIS